METKKIKLAVLGSTRGTDMKTILEAIQTNKLEASIEIVLSNKKDAYLDSIKKYKPGTFLIIECTPGADSYTIHQRSRIITPA